MSAQASSGPRLAFHLAALAWSRTLAVLFLRELRSIFLTVIAYIVLYLSLLANGGVFVVYVFVLHEPQGINMPPMEMFFGQTIFFYIIMLMGPPLVTMRSMSTE